MVPVVVPAVLEYVMPLSGGVVGMGGVGGCELVLAHCWVLEQQAP